ncbi:hypothetical protein DUI87_13086 [Hirundo rustica rustica]|uniref:Uncharacterized protein n=1 Tax=Hirundo rustica rustica TaxID=333673 RepID=A0A3M0KGC8_HIRRU|nr:hypothetical protein DUI87_13086 [Hirundo rustica rustica]
MEALDAMGIETDDKEVECLWVRIKGKANKADTLLGVCYHPPNQEEVYNLFYKQLENASRSPTLVLGVFSGKTACPQDNCPPGLVDGVRDGLPIIQEEAVRELMSHLGVHKCMRSDEIHLRVMTELADKLAKPLSIIYQQSWLIGEVPDDWKLTNVTHIHKKGGREDPDKIWITGHSA